MGIQGLLKALRDVADDVELREYENLTAAVDALCWLHRGIYTCAWELSQGLPTNKFVHYCMGRVNLLLKNGVTPLMVFDGGALPAKRHTEVERQQKRADARRKGLELLREGKRSAASAYFAKSVDVTAEMVLELIKVGN